MDQASRTTVTIRHEYSPGLPEILGALGSSLLISTYQAGKLVAVGVHGGKLDLGYYHFPQAMGVAPRGDRIAVGARHQIWTLRGAPSVAGRIIPEGRFDACFLARSAHFTGEIAIHELDWSGEELWLVNTLFSCLCTLDDVHSFVPRWSPPFVTALVAEDRCHLNGLAMADGRPKFVTVMGQTDTERGWRPGKASEGCLIDVPSGEVVARGLSMPHSPRVFEDEVWVLDSGRGGLAWVDVESGSFETVASLPGFTRGLALAGRYAFVGLSKIRETGAFGGIPIAARLHELSCGVAVVDLESGTLAGKIEFLSGVEEIFDVRLLQDVRNPALSGPNPVLDNRPPIWLIPPPPGPVAPGPPGGR
jgi:uncharacterized protein (TIGR03032 family)